MLPIEGQPILTAAQMRVAEAAAAPTPDAMYALMERAGAGVAEAVRRLAAGAEVLVLCGPGNNGGDGYVAARVLREAGHAVRVAALGEPRSALAVAARRRWTGVVEPLVDAAPAPVLVDALFGTGLTRPLDKTVAAAFGRLLDAANLSIAIDLPSHVDTDTGAVFNDEAIGRTALTFALGALKPSHLLMPAALYCGQTRVIGLSLAVEAEIRTATPPCFLIPRATDHKFSRGLVIVIAGTMPGAARLAAEAAAHGGAGYVTLLGDEDRAAAPHAIVRHAWSPEALHRALEGKENIALIVGPGLGRDDVGRDRLGAAISAGQTMVIDGDALHLLDARTFATFHARDDDAVVLTPHEGEFRALFGGWRGSKIDAAREAARRAGATVVFKGPDTVIATRNGEIVVFPTASRWLSTAGSGDVLSGAIAAAIVNVAVGDAAAAGVWMHAEAARRLGGAFLADDLAGELSAVRSSL